MADISAIKLPNNTTYTIKDNNALPLTGGSVTGPVSFGDSVSIDEATVGDLVVNGSTSFVQGVKANQIVPFKSKTFTGVIGTENNWAGATFFFGSIKPTTWYAIWKVKFNIHIYAPGKDTYHQVSEVMLSGDQGTLRTYSSMNTVANQLVYYGVLYRLKSAGFTNGYGHSIGCRFYSSNYPTDTNYKRTIVVDILETENCTFDFYDSCLLYANIPGTGTTNYDTYSEINWCSNGLQEAGDSDTTDDRQIYFGGKTSASKGIWAGSLFMEDGEGTYQNICAASDGTITASNRTTATTKIANTSGFKIGGKVYYSNTNYGPNTNISGWGVVHNTISLFDTRYAFNTTLTAGSLTVYKPLYLVGTVSNGLFYLDSTYYTQSPTTTGKIYILVGGVYDSTTSNCRMGLYQHNPWYYYDGSKLIPYVENAHTVNGHTVETNVPTNAKFTDTVTTATTTGSGNAVTAITASNGALTITKGATFLTSHQDISGKIDTAGTGLSKSGTTLNHSNSVTAQTTQAIYPIKIDAQGHISAYGSAVTPLTSHQTIKQDGVTGATGNHFGTCSVAAGTAAKTVSITAGTPALEAGLRVTVKFTYANTAGTPTLNVNNLGAKNIFHNGAQITTGANKALLAGTVEFVYDGTQWQLVGNYIDTDTKAWGSITGKPTATGSNTTGITASTTATKTTLGTANSIYGVSSTTTTASKASGSNGTASSWTFAEQIVVVDIEGGIEESEDTLVIGTVVTRIQSKTGGSNGTAPTWSFTDVTVPIKNSSATSIPNVSVASATVSITDNGHTHSIS